MDRIIVPFLDMVTSVFSHLSVSLLKNR